MAPVATFGTSFDHLFPDFERSDQIFVWGANPATDSPPIHLKKIFDAKQRGARVVVIDPLKTYTAEKADEWVGIRPGTDGALALGMAYVIIERGLYDTAFVDDWTYGFEEFREYIKGFSPKTVERITWVKAEQVEKLAENLVKPRTSLLLHTGLEYSSPSHSVGSLRKLRSTWRVGLSNAPILSHSKKSNGVTEKEASDWFGSPSLLLQPEQERPFFRSAEGDFEGRSLSRKGIDCSWRFHRHCFSKSRTMEAIV
jgi:hypothetical protein